MPREVHSTVLGLNKPMIKAKKASAAIQYIASFSVGNNLEPIIAAIRNIPKKIRATLLREEHQTLLGLNMPTINAIKDNSAIIAKTVSITQCFLKNFILFDNNRL